MRAEGLLLLVFVAASCGQSTSPDGPIRLVELADGEVVSPSEEEVAETVLNEAFDTDPVEDGWRVITDPARPLHVSPESLDVRTADGHLTLSGNRGAVYRLIEVQPATCYEFTGRVRARGIESDAEAFFGATFFLAELTRFGPAAELLSAGLDPLVHVRHLMRTAARTDGWQRRRVIHRTGENTRALLVGCLLGLSEEVRTGEVDFDDVRLERVPDRWLWEDRVAEEVRGRRAGEPPAAANDWRAQRLVTAELGGEFRPAVVLLPGELLRFRVRIPAGEARFEAGLGAWPATETGHPGFGRFAWDVDGHVVHSLLFERLPRDSWEDVEVDLSAYAGRTVTFVLSYLGSAPGLVGAPVLHAGATSDELNVVLVSIDTLRADRVGAYGYAQSTTPTLDAFAESALLFRDVTAASPYTLPSHASLFSGQFPSIHAVERGGRVLSSVRSPILARTLAARGYQTQAFTGGGFLNADFGFDKGFDGFSTVDPVRPGLERPLDVGAWLELYAREPFFLFVHTYSLHDYEAPPELLTCRAAGCTSERTDYLDWYMGFRYLERGRTQLMIDQADLEHLGHRYDAALRHVDRAVGALLDRLEELGLAERTIVAITSDHGEELFERGFIQHGKTLYEELTRIPLILRIPGEAPRVVTDPAQLVDVAPTILGALGIPPDPRMQGVDLLRGDPGERILWSEVDDTFAVKTALREASGWKLIYGPLGADVLFPNEKEWELYDLTRDPGEREDLAGSAPAELARLRTALERHRDALEALGASLGEVGQGELDAATLDQLRELGYVE